MNRTEKQKAIATAAKLLANSFKTGAAQPKIQNTSYPFYNGKPLNTIGHVLSLAGVPVPDKNNIFGNTDALAKALGVDSHTLPMNVIQAVEKVRSAEYLDGPYRRRRAAVTPLKTLASVLTTAKIRKAYTKATTPGFIVSL